MWQGSCTRSQSQSNQRSEGRALSEFQTKYNAMYAQSCVFSFHENVLETAAFPRLGQLFCIVCTEIVLGEGGTINSFVK